MSDPCTRCRASGEAAFNLTAAGSYGEWQQEEPVSDYGL
jgi:hypothetical protein